MARRALRFWVVVAIGAWLVLAASSLADRATASPQSSINLIPLSAFRPVPVPPLDLTRTPLPSPTIAPTATPRPTPRPTRAPVRAAAGAAIAGVASWYCGAGSACTLGYPGGLYAAAGPALRVGDWRGRVVVVEANGRSIRVRLVDWCACPHRALDLYRDAFRRLADPSRGLVQVRVSW